MVKRHKVRGPHLKGDEEVFSPEDPAWQASWGPSRGLRRSQPGKMWGREFQAEGTASLGLCYTFLSLSFRQANDLLRANSVVSHPRLHRSTTETTT